MNAVMIAPKFQNAKRGELFYTTLNNRGTMPKVLVFQGIKGKKAIFEVAVPMNDADKTVAIPVDDPEGQVPKLTEPVMEKLQQRVTEIQQDLTRYLAVAAQLYEYQKQNHLSEWINPKNSEMEILRKFLNVVKAKAKNKPAVQ